MQEEDYGEVLDWAIAIGRPTEGVLEWASAVRRPTLNVAITTTNWDSRLNQQKSNPANASAPLSCFLTTVVTSLIKPLSPHIPTADCEPREPFLP